MHCNKSYANVVSLKIFHCTVLILLYNFFSFFIISQILTIGLRNLLKYFFLLSLLSRELAPFHFKDKLYSFSLACPNQYAGTLGPLWSKTRLRRSPAMPVDLPTTRVTKWEGNSMETLDKGTCTAWATEQKCNRFPSGYLAWGTM